MKRHLLAASLLLAAALPAAELKFSGYLGQTQPENPLPNSSVDSVAAIGKTVFFTNGGGTWQLDQTTKKAKKVFMNGSLFSDGKDVYLYTHPNVRRLFLKPDGSFAYQNLFRTPQYVPGINAVPVSATEEFGKKMKFFWYDARKKQVIGWDAKGKDAGVVTDLSKEKFKGRIVGIGVMPKNGLLLVSTEYPDMRTYRFDTAGKQKIGGIWPCQGWFTGFSNVGADVFSVSGARMDETLVGKGFSVGDQWNNYARGVASDGNGGYFVATSQGLKHYPEGKNHAADYRLGGTGNLAFIALSNGRVICGTGYGIMPIKLDDLPDSPLECTGNEPWHIGGNWCSVGVGAAGNGDVYYFADSKLKKIWAFEPLRTKWNDKKRMTTAADKLKNPTDVTVQNGKIIYADDGKLNVPCSAAFPIRKVAAVGRDGLVIAGKDKVAYVKNGKTVWTKDLKASDVAGMDDFIAVAGDQLFLFDLTGKQVSALPYKLNVIDANGKWLVGADPAKKAVCKFKLKK